ncbi:hypothetical protein SCHPADRAFT_993254 [Schizopora paradoxa]|uniref:DUF6699 domain-containing protein n=1 Tax=Schizopora paradoxa TaxID=27342 RepID=A0A0H2S499_9AGAM|nr:hypothetical protein SCHPADRAFT_993254 [Schizopora paradoxa]
MPAPRRSCIAKIRIFSNLNATVPTQQEMNTNWPHPSPIASPKFDFAVQPTSNRIFGGMLRRSQSDTRHDRKPPRPASAQRPTPTSTPLPVLAPAPITSPRPILRTPGVLQICPLLRRGSSELVDYDLRVPHDYARKYLPSPPGIPQPSCYLSVYDLHQPACYPLRQVLYVTALLVYPPHLPPPGPWIVPVPHSRTMAYVTVRDVLNTLYEAFHASPDVNAWLSVGQCDPAMREYIIKAQRRRCKKRAMKLNTSVEAQKREGVVCLDWFGPKTYFGGLALVNDGDYEIHSLSTVVYERK